MIECIPDRDGHTNKPPPFQTPYLNSCISCKNIAQDIKRQEIKRAEIERFMDEATALRKTWEEEGREGYEERIKVLDARIEKGRAVLERLDARIEKGRKVLERLGRKNGVGYFEELRGKMRKACVSV